MEKQADKPDPKEEARALRKKTKRVEESRSLIKAKNREKGKIIKTYQDRQTELEQSRDDWKEKFKKEKMERIELDKKYNHIATLFEIKEEELMEILKEFAEFKKKHPQKKP